MQPPLIDEHMLPRVPQQARSRAKREALLTAAMDLFGRYGYEAVSIETIVTQAGSSVGTFYAYFHSKQQLLLVLLQRYLDALFALNLMQFGDEERPIMMIDRAVRRALAPDAMYAGLWRAWREAIIGDASLAAIDHRVIAWAREYVVRLLEQLRAYGAMRSDLDLPALATLINELMWQLAQRAQFLDESVIHATVKMIYHTIFQDSD
jgi:AcrR family transcriptional regulator